MIKFHFSMAALLVLSFSASAAIPEGYYDGLEGKSGVTLKQAVKSAARNHTPISYGSSSWEVFIESDTRYVDGRLCWWDMYSDENVPAPSASSHSGMNIEHSVAKSWWGGSQNDAYKDLMHLNPSNSDANSRKSNYPLGEIKTETWSNGVTFIGNPTSSTGGGSKYVYEPADDYKGDFARVFFYMFTIYDDISWTSSCDWMFDTSSNLLLKPWAYEMLLRWAAADPVSQKELDRNEAIFKHQKNRNPFIDYPELAEHIWGAKKNTPFHIDGDVTPPGGGTDTPDTPPVDPDTPDVPEESGFWYAVTDASHLNENDKYVIVSTENHKVMSTSVNGNGSANYFHPCSDLPLIDDSVEPYRLTGIPSDAAVIRLLPDGRGWVLAVSDVDDRLKGYMSCTATKKVTLANNVSANGTVAAITPGAEETKIVYGENNKLQYNNQSNALRFTTYTSNQEPIWLYRLEEDRKDVETGIGTGLPETADEVIYGIYSVDGVKVSTEGISELPKGIYIVISNFGTRKIMK